ncbi:FtsX-like permease family protein [Amphibacillus sp. MSJ-3]|uniref:FtsX-like permease family protein n=1 Tax=Amphibacillus sp. MSJ-3 TaxID=2841505 RepID=UPI00209CE476|nr:FtsX-like permease family protein [Amphibacillus sp. MSJ-3]
MKKTAMYKLIFKEIVNSKARFLSIFILIVLGVGFFAGIQATGPNMLNTIDQYFKQQHLYDLHLQSTMGIEEGELELLRDYDPVDILEVGYSQDVLVGENRLVMKLIGYHEDHQLNQYLVKSGRLPEKSGEIALDDFDLIHNHYEIGDQVTLYSDREETDLTEQFNETTYEVVGFVTSPRYFVNVSRGQTSIGGGQLDAFGVIREEDFNLPVHTDLFVTFNGLQDKDTYSDKYKNLTSQYQSEIEHMLEDYAPKRLADIKADAEEELDDAEAEIADGRAELDEARAELDDAREQLDDGKAKLARARDELAQAHAELTKGESDYEQGLATFNQEISQAEEQLEQGEQELAQEQGKLDQAADELSQGEQELNQASRGIEAQYKELSNQQADWAVLMEEISDLLEVPIAFIPDQTIEDILNETDDIELNGSTLAALLEAYFAEEIPAEQVKQVLDQVNTEIEDGLLALDQARDEIEVKRSELDSNQKELTSGQNELDQARQTLDQQGSLLEQEKQAGEADLADARLELDQGWKEYNEGLDLLSDEEANLIEAEEEYKAGLATFEEESAEALEEIESGEEEIAEAREELAELEEPSYYPLLRTDNSAFLEYEENAARLSELASIFPVVFFAVAALVTLTTITRMIEEQRGEIGTLKALGYRNWEISMKYYVYALSASLLGTIFGLVLGYTALPLIIFNAYGMLYDLPDLILTNYWSYTLISASIALLSTVITAWFVLRVDLRSQPAVLMRPKAPKIGKRILLERITPLWRRFDFIKKVTARNLFRYKQRMLMTILGISGCAALIIAGFGVKGAVEGLIDLQYGKVLDYNAMVILDDEAGEDEASSYQAFIDQYEGIDQDLLVFHEQFEAKQDGLKSQDLNVFVPKSPEQLEDFIHLRDRTSGEPHQLNDEGAIVTEKLANLFDIEPGDKLTLVDGDNQSYQVEISAVTENYTGHYLYMTEAVYRSEIKDSLAYNANLLKYDRNRAWEDELLEGLMLEDQVVTVSANALQIESFDDSMASLNIVVVVLIVAAAGLAFVVLYNLTNINVSERIRELSTIKVLGFYDNEVTMYIYRENLTLTIMGIIAGGVFGRLLFTFVLDTVSMDNMMFNPGLDWTSYLYAALLTFSFSTFVMWMMHHKLKKIDMIEALKSNE